MAPISSNLIVRLSDRQVGTITRLAGDRHVFAFDEAYIDDPNRPILSLSFKSQTGGVVTAIRPHSVRLPPFFSNLLPEGHLRDYLAARAGVKPEREFFLLAALGEDLPGAVTVHEDGAGDRDHAADHHHDALTNALRFSLAGVQLKFSAVMEAAGGLTIPAGGVGGEWIVKLPSARFPAVPENEFAMMELARRIGIEVPKLGLIPVEAIAGLPDEARAVAGKALVVERFDRTADGGRVHMEDFAQVFGIFPDDKYDKRSYANIAAVLAAEIGEAAVIDFMRRLAFSILIGNADMHLKNWSLLYPDGRKPVLAPAYDYVSTVPYLPKQQLALGFGRSKAMDDITPDQVRRFADTAQLSVPFLWKTILRTVEETRAAWRDHAARDLLPADLRKTLEARMENVAANIGRH
ncbi:MAG TPA: HipA domain-containing protein [Hyphomicrobiaceae bacterium]